MEYLNYRGGTGQWKMRGMKDGEFVTARLFDAKGRVFEQRHFGDEAGELQEMVVAERPRKPLHRWLEYDSLFGNS